jgi:hypothetical protein
MYKLFLWVVGHFCPPESGSGSSALQKAPHLWTVFVLHGLDALDDEEEDEADDGAQPQGIEQGGGERVSCLTQQKKNVIRISVAAPRSVLFFLAPESRIGMGKKNPDPGPGINIPDYIFENLLAIFGFKILQFFN